MSSFTLSDHTNLMAPAQIIFFQIWSPIHTLQLLSLENSPVWAIWFLKKSQGFYSPNYFKKASTHPGRNRVKLCHFYHQPKAKTNPKQNAIKVRTRQLLRCCYNGKSPPNFATKKTQTNKSKAHQKACKALKRTGDWLVHILTEHL